MSAKELGQIHVLSDQTSVINTALNTPVRRYDLAGMATQKLQRMVRQGNFFKLVGIDISLNAGAAALSGVSGSVSGYFRYYAPTKGRCAAFRHAFKAMADQMKMQGIAMRNNHLYDFRVALTEGTGSTSPLLKNQATLDGITGLCLNNGTSAGASVFDVYNKSVVPRTTLAAGDLFDEGFDTLLQSGAGTTDFVLNDDPIYSGNEDYASLIFDKIPFSIHFGNGNATAFQFRPDPALYVAIMTGNLEMFVEDVEVSSPTTLELDVSFMVSGWKSIMGNPDKKKKSGRRSKKKR